eukprot:1897197-Alexandrium_andersonii.AAC.1
MSEGDQDRPKITKRRRRKKSSKVQQRRNEQKEFEATVGSALTKSLYRASIKGARGEDLLGAVEHILGQARVGSLESLPT